MGRLILMIIVGSCISANSCSKNINDQFTNDKTVYICKGAYSKSYHFDAECQGLRRCTTEIFETELKSAEKKGRTLCSYEN